MIVGTSYRHRGPGSVTVIAPSLQLSLRPPCRSRTSLNTLPPKHPKLISSSPVQTTSPTLGTAIFPLGLNLEILWGRGLASSEVEEIEGKSDPPFLGAQEGVQVERDDEPLSDTALLPDQL